MLVHARACARSAFWRAAKLSGEVVADVKAGPVFNVYDETRPIADKPGEEQPALVTFINGDPARVWGARSFEDRKAGIARQAGGKAQNNFGWPWV